MQNSTILVLVGLAIAAGVATTLAVYDPLTQFVVGTVPGTGDKPVRVVSVPDAKGMLSA